MEKYGKAFSIIHSSKELKRLIIQRIKRNKISPYLLAKRIGTTHLNLMLYFNEFNTLKRRNIKDTLTEFEILKMCEILQIHVTLRLRLKSEEEIDTSELTIDYYYKGIDTREKSKQNVADKYFVANYDENIEI